MSKVRNTLLATLVVITSSMSLTAFAQAPNHAGHGMMNDARREAHRTERQQKHLDEMKVFLQLQASQEGAWNAFESVMKSPMKRPSPASMAELEKLSTPERIDKMMAIKAEHDAEISKRMNASQTFYATLTPAQQKVFDTQTQKFFHRGMLNQHGTMHH